MTGASIGNLLSSKDISLAALCRRTGLCRKWICDLAKRGDQELPGPSTGLLRRALLEIRAEIDAALEG